MLAICLAAGLPPWARGEPAMESRRDATAIAQGAALGYGRMIIVVALSGRYSMIAVSAPLQGVDANYEP